MENSNVPLGYVFQPSDEELIRLLPKKKNEPLPCHCIVREFNQFGSIHPYQIWDLYNGSPDGKTDLYFFVKSNQSGSRIIQADRSRGRWKNEGNKKVCNMDNQTIGMKRRFSYKNPGLPEQNCQWIMYEYSLEVEGSVPYVIRRLRKKPEKKNESTSRETKSQTQSQHRAQVQHSAADQLLPPNSQHEEDVENQGSIWVAEFLKTLQNSGSTSHRQDHSSLSDLSSSPLRDDLLPLPELFAANPSAYPEPQSPFRQNMS